MMMATMTNVCGCQSTRLTYPGTATARLPRTSASKVSFYSSSLRSSSPASKMCVSSTAEDSVGGDRETSRRSTLLLTGTALLGATLADVGPANAKGGFEVVRDQQDAYQFVYPFGWQEVSIPGQDVVYKDVIEPLESVSVSYIPTEKASISDYGDVKEVSYTLVRKVLTNVNQDVSLLSCEERKDDGGRIYYDFEYTASTPRYTRHAMASVTVGNGKFYTLETGANEKRWRKMADKIKKVQKSFVVGDRTDY